MNRPKLHEQARRAMNG